MKIAQVCPRYYPFLGGIETQVMKVSKLLTSKGLQLEVLTADPTNKLPREESINGVLIRRFKSWAPTEAYYFSGELKSFLKNHFFDYDVVHAHSYQDYPAVYAAQAKKHSGQENLFVFTPHYHEKGNSLFTSFLRIFYKPLIGQNIFNQADVVICVSNYERRVIERNFPNTVRKTVTIPNGVDFRDEENSLFANLPRESSQRYILYVGRIEPYKHVDRLVAALRYLSRKDVSLVIVGKGPSKAKIVALAGDLGIQDRILFYENLGDEELAALYRNSSALVNLSEFEAYGLTVAEALARGTPCVVAKSSALAEWVDNLNCLGVDDTKDAKLVAKAIDDVIDRRVSGVKLPSWADVAQSLIDVYNRKVMC